jgi:signal transduction histidine kinase/ActR/RegA family two-component response regulator
MNGPPTSHTVTRRAWPPFSGPFLVVAVTFASTLFNVRNWTDVKISVAVAAVLCIDRRTGRTVAAMFGVFSGHLVLGNFLDVGGWPVSAWIIVGSLAALEVWVLSRILFATNAEVTTRLPSRRILGFIGWSAIFAVVGGSLEASLLELTDASVSASAADLVFAVAITACLGAIAVTRRGSDWWKSGRSPGSELLAPLMVVLITLVGIQITRQVWSQRNDDRLEVLARSVHATLSAQWERETDVLRARSEGLAPILAFDISTFAEVILPYLEGSEVAVAAAVGTSINGSTSNSTAIVDDGTVPVEIPNGLFAGSDSIVSVDGSPLVLERVALVPLPDGGDLVLTVAFSLPELVRAATTDVIGRFDDIGIVVLDPTQLPAVDVWSDANIDPDAVRVLAGSMTFGRSELVVAVSPTQSFGSQQSTMAAVLGLESGLGLLLGGVLILGANAEFKMSQERRRRENLLEAALDATPGSSVVFDSDFRVLAANRPVRQAFAAQIPGLEVFRLFGLDQDSGRRRLVEDVLRKALDGQPASLEIAEDASDGNGGATPSASRMKILELSAYPVISPGGEPVGFLHCVDATERRNLAMRSAQSERMESLGALAGGLAHDFNNLLFVTLGNLQLMAMNESVVRDEKLSKFVSRSMSAVERGAEITKSLLAVARSQPLEESPVTLADLVKGILPLVRQALGAGRRVEVDIADPGLQLMLDPGRLSSCILNLAFNARDAMGPNGTLSISAKLDEASDMVELSIADDGAGMPPEVVARAFEPFFTTKSPGSGTGLGLATVYAFAKQSGGTAYLESRIGSGTKVTMVLPRYTGVVAPAEVVSARRSGRRVVVADDEQDLAEMVASWLIDMGIDARFATSPKSALELIETFEPDVLVSDANFGEELDGIELARLGTAIVPEMAVVFMTGYSTSMRELQELGERTLAKPFSREDLYSALSPLIAEETSDPRDRPAAPTSGRKKGRS